MQFVLAKRLLLGEFIWVWRMKGAVAWYNNANSKVCACPELPARSCVPPAHQSFAETDSQKYLRWVVQGLCRIVDFLCPRCLSKTRQSLCWLNFSIETINTPCYTSASIVPHKVADRTSWQLLESIHLLKDQIWWFLKFALSTLPGVKGQLEFTDDMMPWAASWLDTNSWNL